MTHNSRLTTFVDTHTHLYEAQFDADRTVMIERAINTGVSKMIIPNVDSATIKGMLDLVQQFSTNIFPMMGLHPCYVKPESYKAELEIVRQYLFNDHNFIYQSQISNLKRHNSLLLAKLALIYIGIKVPLIFRKKLLNCNAIGPLKKICRLLFIPEIPRIS
jgi:hypothetical protein